MNISSVGMAQMQPKSNKLNAATKGALYTAGILGTSTAMSWVKTPETMQSIVTANGGKAKYALKYLGCFAALSTAGALVGVAVSKIAEKVKHHQSVN